MQTINDLRVYLTNVRQRNQIDVEGYKTAKHALSLLKSQFVTEGEQDIAKEIWCLETILNIQHWYADAFNKIKAGEFYDAWVLLERIEIAFCNLEKHHDVVNDGYFTSEIFKHTEQFQSLYPYRLFISPGAIHKKKSCSVCGSKISIRNGCSHEKGEIYNGEMCHHVVEEVRFLELSVVPNPVQKYSVMWLMKDGEQIDNYDYSNVAYVAAGLQKPYDGWDLQWTMIREPHSQYRGVGRNDRCPCGSNKKYKHCCLKTEGVLKPHARVIYEVEPPASVPKFKGATEYFPHNSRNQQLSKIDGIER